MAETLTLRADGFTMWINYLTSNLRITTVEWDLPARQDVVCTATLTLYDTDISDTVPLIVQSETSPSSGTENVPGAQYRMVWIEDANEEGGGYYDLPPNLSYTLSMTFVRQ